VPHVLNQRNIKVNSVWNPVGLPPVFKYSNTAIAYTSSVCLELRM